MRLQLCIIIPYETLEVIIVFLPKETATDDTKDASKTWILYVVTAMTLEPLSLDASAIISYDLKWYYCLPVC